MAQTLEQALNDFGLEAVSDSVKHLSQLVANKNASLEETAAIISGDASLSEQLLRSANPNAASPEEYTITSVEQALARAGTGWALILALSEPLTRAVQNTLQVMLSMDLSPVPLSRLNTVFEDHIVCETSFSGRISGSVAERMTFPSARELGARLLGITAEDLASEEALVDAMAELSNMISGNFKSNLCDAGLTCQLNLPKISRASFVQSRAISLSAVQRFGFVGPGFELFADLAIHPWGE